MAGTPADGEVIIGAVDMRDVPAPYAEVLQRVQEKATAGVTQLAAQMFGSAPPTAAAPAGAELWNPVLQTRSFLAVLEAEAAQ